MPRESWFGRLVRHFHEHPQGRLHEILFWGGIGVVLGGLTALGWWRDVLSTPIALMLAVVSLCFVGWAMLPQRKVTPKTPPVAGRRGELAKLKEQRRKGR